MARAPSNMTPFLKLFFVILFYAWSCVASPSTCDVKMTEDELEFFNGTQPNQPIYLAIGGKVYDVTASTEYSPKGMYSVFAGRACTRGISLPSLKQEDISDDVSDFNEENLANLKYWTEFFEEKYPLVALLVPDDDEARKARIKKHILLAESYTLERIEAKEAVVASDQEDRASYEEGRSFTESELLAFNGQIEGNPILVSIGGHVLDVTSSAFLYGKGNPRECFAGRSITRISARMISKDNKPASPCDEDDLARGNELIGLTVQELGQLKKKVKFFLDKFERVGYLIGVDVILP